MGSEINGAGEDPFLMETTQEMLYRTIKDSNKVLCF
jgi:hypothetical protein